MDPGASRRSLEERARRLSDAQSGSGDRSGDGQGRRAGDRAGGGAGSGAAESGKKHAGDSTRTSRDGGGFSPPRGGEGPGSGGVSRGPGAAPLTFEARLGRVPELFPLEKLPGRRSGASGEIWAVRAVAPRRHSGRDSPHASGSAAEGGRGGGVWDEKLLPRNRDLARRYFGDEQP